MTKPKYNLIQCEQLHFQVKDKRLLEDISFSIAQNERIAILGHNGAGKSTLIDLLLTDLKPTQGSITYPLHGNFQAFKKKLGVVYDQSPFYPMLKVKEILHLIGSMYGVDYRQEKPLIGFLELESILEKLFSQLSKGEKKKVAIFIACTHAPDLLILDEPTAEIDPIISKTIWEKVFLAKERSILFSTHRWEEAIDYADKIMFLKEGKILAGLLSVTELQKTIEGVKIKIPKSQIDIEHHDFKDCQKVEDADFHYLYPKKEREKKLIHSLSSHTFNFTIEDKNLEDHYKILG